MGKKFSHGSGQDMLNAFRDALRQDTQVESSTYIDTDGVFNEPGSKISYEEIRDYWDNNYDDDPSLQEYDSFENWWKDTKAWLKEDVDSCGDIFAESYGEVSMNDASSPYIEELIDYCDAELTAEDFFDGITWEELDKSLELTCVDGKHIFSYSIPKSDLSMRDVEEDGDYICNTVRADLNEGDYLNEDDDVQPDVSCSSNLHNKYEDTLTIEQQLIDELNNSGISLTDKLSVISELVGNWGYTEKEAQELYSRISETLEADKSIQCASEDEETFELIDTKLIADSDGFMTDYTLYRNKQTGEYVTVFGDRDIYKPEDGYFDAEFETLGEAEDWFCSYEGLES